MKMVINADLMITINQIWDFVRIDVHEVLVLIIYYFNICLFWSVIKLLKLLTFIY